MIGRIGLFGVTCCLALCSCIRMPDGRGPRRPGPKEAVHLPAKPDLSPKRRPLRYEDGALTVAGFLEQARASTGKKVTVRGWVKEVKKCKKGAELCRTVPHLLLVDDLNRPGTPVMVVGNEPDDVLEAYPPGSRQTLEGKVSLWSPDGRLVNLDGLLVVEKPPQKEESGPEDQGPTAAAR